MFRILILVLALSCGGVAAWLAMGTAGQPTASAAVVTDEVAAPDKEVLVAASNLAHGTVLKETDLRWQPWTAGDVPAVFMSRAAQPDAPEALKGSLVRGGFVAGEPIRDDRLAQPGAGFLSGQLPSGKRAIAVRVTAESTAGGFILPNDRVDLIHTRVNSGQEGGEKVSSRTILSNIRVLAVDQTATGVSDGAPVVGKTATLEVDPQQIPLITAAEASGSISLALRAASDKAEPTAIMAEAKRTRTIRIFGGDTLRTVEFPSFGREGS
ncbi:Flp pilus assembly protein CpaB [Nitratireductor sp. ZSWI3]|uniref:Flp pilus assembly protein CpaB n=1 Tax=Nitratireductor sp. ZSWI3 TaxID=2966359 RepID=UPI0021506AE7|nr:Flp pilus assembly protein CpaB [Nitratireductor sp. ZSWI3]MCR4264734.1 Flp pilus assembly protein CpaB [Nitratireductor sp. ZSWI3]